MVEFEFGWRIWMVGSDRQSFQAFKLFNPLHPPARQGFNVEDAPEFSFLL
jgi:hypothetical protein